MRHRLASFAQESTRYCNYGTKGGEITVIKPCFLKENTLPYDIWADACATAEKKYLAMLVSGATPQEARSVLPHSTKADIVLTVNLREWRHFFSLRAVETTGKAHPQMLEVTRPLLYKVNELIPVVFEDLATELTQKLLSEKQKLSEV